MKNIRIYPVLAILVVLITLFFPKEGKFPYEYQKGRPWIYETLIAPIDFPLLKSEAEMLREKEEKSDQFIDYYNYDASVAKVQLEQFYAAAADAGLEESLVKYVAGKLGDAYRVGVLSEFNGSGDGVIMVKRDKRLSEIPESEVKDVPTLYMTLKSSLRYDFPDQPIDSLMDGVGLKDFIVPNLLFDENFTQLAHREAVNFISPTKGVVYAGQLIVTKGETVTSDICEMLDSYKAEYKLSFGYQGSYFSLLMSHLIQALAMVLLLFFVLFFLEEKVLDDIRKVIFFASLLFVSFLVTALMFKYNPGYLYIVPYSVLALFIGAFFRPSVVAATYTVSLLPLLMIPDNGLELFMMNMTAGAVLQFAYQRFNRGWMQFVNIIFLFIAMGLIYSSFHVAKSEAVFFSERELMLVGINSLLVVMMYPFVFIIEKIFSFVSYSRLWDLSDTNNKLLRMLQMKAPGTFQHSLQVANLAENAARAIGADAMLVRVGAMYHDIGKSENPLCFTENQPKGMNYHKGMPYTESAAEIIRHVDDGLALAEKAKLPKVVTDFILTHHGTSLTGFFYGTYCKEGGDPNNTAPFTYHGQKPHTKEQAVLMAADSIEAAARSLETYTEESVSELVEGIVSGKRSQFDESDISIKDIETIKSAFKHDLMQIYHSRVAYPKRRNVKTYIKD
ncbi:MAG: HDIG domain-containing protein [Bacteroidales bacterium]|nr:HDIG domain-containing protein [Candidatus Cacconaster merdequi]